MLKANDGVQFGLIHISAGDLLRAEVKAGTAAGKLAADYMNRGQLVPNKVVVDMVKNRLAQPDAQEQGWLLDGYPRSADQAAAILEEGIHPDVFLLIQVCHSYNAHYGFPLFEHIVWQAMSDMPGCVGDRYQGNINDTACSVD